MAPIRSAPLRSAWLRLVSTEEEERKKSKGHYTAFASNIQSKAKTV
jgi:hypothetical protein